VRSLDGILKQIDPSLALVYGNIRIAIDEGPRADPSELATIASLSLRHKKAAAKASIAVRVRPCPVCRHAAHPKAVCPDCPPGSERCTSNCAKCLHPAHKGALCPLCPPRPTRAFCSAFCWLCRHAGTPAEHADGGCSACPAGSACHSDAPSAAEVPEDGRCAPGETDGDAMMASPCRRSGRSSGCSTLCSADPDFMSPRARSAGSASSGGSPCESESELGYESGAEAEPDPVDDSVESVSDSEAETESSEGEDALD
jgi:hypothetical protein